MNAFTPTDGLLPGFSDPVIEAQRVFRAVLEAMARPGTIVDLPVALAPPAPLNPATAAVVLALADFETPLWLDAGAASEPVAQYLRFHCGCPLTTQSRDAAFALITAPRTMPPLTAFNAGSDEYPDCSTTLILQVPTLTNGEAWQLSGPGIRDSVRLAPGGFPSGFRHWIADNHAQFPRGVDLIFTSGTTLAALPRSTVLEG